MKKNNLEENVLGSIGQDDLLRGVDIELSASKKIILNVKLKVPGDISGLTVLGTV